MLSHGIFAMENQNPENCFGRQRFLEASMIRKKLVKTFALTLLAASAMLAAAPPMPGKSGSVEQIVSTTKALPGIGRAETTGFGRTASTGTTGPAGKTQSKLDGSGHIAPRQCTGVKGLVADGT
ncbi:MAG TPA: hypothetical protein VF800_13035 [Telluria sp.]|jgi:hypothetical protein